MWYKISLVMAFTIPIIMMLAIMIHDYWKNSYTWRHKYERGIIRNFFAYTWYEWEGLVNLVAWYLFLLFIEVLIVALIIFVLYIAYGIAHTFIWR